MPRFNTFPRNASAVNLKVSYKWWNIQARENSTSIQDRDKKGTSEKRCVEKED